MPNTVLHCVAKNALLSYDDKRERIMKIG